MALPRKTQYSGKFAAGLKPELQFTSFPSRTYSRLTLVAHSFSLLVVILSALPYSVKALMSLGLFISGYTCYVAALRSIQINWKQNDTLVWSCMNNRGTVTARYSGIPKAGCYQCRAFVVLCIEQSPPARTGSQPSLLIPRDAVSEADFRALRSRLTLLDVAPASR